MSFLSFGQKKKKKKRCNSGRLVYFFLLTSVRPVTGVERYLLYTRQTTDFHVIFLVKNSPTLCLFWSLWRLMLLGGVGGSGVIEKAEWFGIWLDIVLSL